MKEIHVLADWGQVKAMGDPLRMRMLEAFKDKPRTTKQVASLLGEPPTRLYHHTELLERAGLIRPTHTRRNRGTTEKYYLAIAQDFIVERKLLELRGLRRSVTSYESLFLSALEATLSEARRTVAAHLIQPLARGRNALIHRFHFRCGEVEMKKRLAIVRGWIDECRRFHRRRNGPEYGITIAFYPRKKRETR